MDRLLSNNFAWRERLSQESTAWLSGTSGRKSLISPLSRWRGKGIRWDWVALAPGPAMDGSMDDGEELYLDPAWGLACSKPLPPAFGFLTTA